MLIISFLLTITFLSSFFAIKLLNPVAVKIGLTDKPDVRKQHIGEIPLLGGICVYLGMLISGGCCLFFFPLECGKITIYLFASLIMVITGTLDDKFDLSVKIRLFIQIILASIMMFNAGDAIYSLGNLFSNGDVRLGYMAYPFTIIAVLGAINAYNMVDGIDGLLGGISISTFLILAILFLMAEQQIRALFCFFCIAALSAYLFYNLQLTRFSRTKIFMGDAGSMLVGLTIVWLLVIGTQRSDLSSEVAFQPVVALWIVAVPLMDMMAIMLRRIKKGTSPFASDREHLHHIFMRAGFSSKETLLIITLISCVSGLIGVLATLFAVPDWLQLVVFTLLFFAYNYLLAHVWLLVKYVRNAMRKEVRM